MNYDSFTYNNVDMYGLAFLKIISYDVFTAPLRARKVIVPERSGAYDYGAKYHDERQLRMECVIDKEITDTQFDDLKYTLSRKGRIILWDKPDRYYYGRAYDAAEIIDYYRHCLREFELVFDCDPYAYALDATILKTSNLVLPIDYEGTRETPTRITIRNTGLTAMSGIQITVRNSN